jgi:hypothetical protein
MIYQLHLLALDELVKVKIFKGTKYFKSEYKILVQVIKILDNKSLQEILFLSKEGSSGFIRSARSDFYLASIPKIRQKGKFPSIYL